MIKFTCSVIMLLLLVVDGSATPAMPEQAGRAFDLYARPTGATKASGGQNATSESPQTREKLDAEGRRVVDFSQLAGFAYTPPADSAERPRDPCAGIPEEVRKLDGKRVSISGYMLPIKMEDGRAKQFLILRNQMACCYGVAPAPNEWIVVRSAKGVAPTQDVVAVYIGILRVGVLREQGYFIGIYELELEQ